MLLHFLLQSENVLEVAKRAKRSLADSFNTMVRRKVIMILMTMMMINDHDGRKLQHHGATDGYYAQDIFSTLLVNPEPSSGLP